MSNSNDILTCLLCLSNENRSSLINHIYKHINYFRHYCNNCDFKAIHSHEIMEHQLKTGHSIIRDEINLYLERISTIIYSDCLYQAEFGEEAMLSRTSFLEDSNSVTTTNKKKTILPSTSEIESPVVSNGKSITTSAKKSNIKPDVDNNSDEPLLIKRQTVKQNNDVVNNNTFEPIEEKSSKNQKQCEVNDSTFSDEAFLTESEMSDFSRVLNRGHPTITCTNCSTVVPNDYPSYKEHIIKHHLENFNSEYERDTFIAKFIQVYFPSAISSNDYQCCACGHEMRSLSGRRSHVSREHLFVTLKCPQKNCVSSFFQMEKFIEHVFHSNSSSTPLNNDEQSDFEKSKRLYYIKLRLLTTRCFPCPLPHQNNSEDLIPHNYKFSVFDDEKPLNYNNAPKFRSKHFVRPKILRNNLLNSKNPNLIDKKFSKNKSNEKIIKKGSKPFNSRPFNAPLIISNKNVSPSNKSDKYRNKRKQDFRNFYSEPTTNYQSPNIKILKKGLHESKNSLTPTTTNNISNPKSIKNVNKKTANDNDFVEIIKKEPARKINLVNITSSSSDSSDEPDNLRELEKRRNRVSKFVDEINEKEETRKRKGDFILRRSSNSITETNLKKINFSSSSSESPPSTRRPSLITETKLMKHVKKENV